MASSAQAEASSADKLLFSLFSNTFLYMLFANNFETILYHTNLLSKELPRDLRTLSVPVEQGWGPLNFIVRSSLSAYEGVIKATVRGQTFVNIARTAIALERRRLGHGSYPSTLEELAPKFLPVIPAEVFDGAPLHYRLKDDAQGFILYSTGWTGTDDGGAMDYSKPEKTNWVWSTP